MVDTGVVVVVVGTVVAIRRGTVDVGAVANGGLCMQVCV
jgi:hypothetical protein